MKLLNILCAAIAISQCVASASVPSNGNDIIVMDDKPTNDNNGKVVLYPHPRTPGQRPRAPFRDMIKCQIDGQRLSVWIPVNLEYVELQIERDGIIIYSGVFTAENSEAIVEFVSGEYMLTAVDNNNIEYEGAFVL